MSVAKISYYSAMSTGVSCDVASGSKLTIGESVTITLTFDMYYGTASLPELHYIMSGETYYTETFTKVSDKVYQITTDFNHYGSAIDRNVQIYCLPQELFFNLDLQLSKCSSNYEAGDYEPGEMTFTVTCEEGSEFSILPYLYCKTAVKEYTYDFEKVSDTEYSYTITPVKGRTYSLIGEATAKTVISDKYGLITSYYITKDELKEISSKRWIERTYEPKYTMGDTVMLYAGEDEYIDTARYIVRLFRIFMDVPESPNKEKLYFGPYDMGIECSVIPSDIISLDFGTVEIEGKYKNTIDYNNTDIVAYLPFVGNVSLNTKDFMDKTVRLVYQVNTLNGDTLVILYADGLPLITHSCNIAIDVPYQLGGNEMISTGMEANNNYIKGEPPAIYVKERKAASPTESLPYKDVKYRACFGDLTGYTQVTEIDFVVKSNHITKTEIDEIIQRLENGVFL